MRFTEKDLAQFQINVKSHDKTLRQKEKTEKKTKIKEISLPNLLKKAQKVFNEWVRLRDYGKPCISCGKYIPLQAGHFFSAGKHSALRFLEDNVNGQCLSCNYFKSGDLLNYRKNLIERIGIERVERLDFLAAAGKRTVHKWSRFELQEIITKYSEKIKTFKK